MSGARSHGRTVGQQRTAADSGASARLRRIGCGLCQPGRVPDDRVDADESQSALLSESGRLSESAPITARHSVVPDAAGRSLWLAAVWTGVGAAVVCATVSLVAVAVCWLPVSGPGTRATTTIRAGLLTFLAALHGGVTIDGSHTAWLPLGMMLAVAVTAWRAGSGLADASGALGERKPRRLVLAGATQAVSFTLCCLLAVPFATLGTSRASLWGVAAGALVLFAISGGTAFVRSSALRDWCSAHTPAEAAPVARAAGVAVSGYLGVGAFLVIGSIAVHHDRVESISRQVGGGWGGVPILLLGVLAAPNAVIAGASYLAGPGFAVGAGTSVTVTSTAHGTLPAFPLLGALPSGHGATGPILGLAIATPLFAGLAVTRLAARRGTWFARLRVAGCAALLAGFVMLLLGWQGGGAIGDARLRTVGASPWQLGGAVAAEVAAVSLPMLGLVALWRWLRRPKHGESEVRPFLPRRLLVFAGRAADDDEDGKLAG